MNNVKRPARTIHASVVWVIMLFWPLALYAQELSYDGNRWFEVEISVFTNEYPASQYSEQPVAKNLALQYLPKLQTLLTPISSLMIEFPEPELPGAGPQREPENSQLQNPDSRNSPTVEIGPVYSPALPGSYKVNDYARDPFIALAGRAARFSSINRNLVDSSEHRILWHQVWRQPIQPRAQTPAIFVYGGEVYGEGTGTPHAELEGSLRLSDLGGKPTLDINLWRNEFGAPQLQPGESEWKVPELPLPLDEVEAPSLVPAPVPIIIAVWQMQQTRDLSPEQLYYLDHPALGVIIQLRPYLLPEQPVITDEGDF